MRGHTSTEITAGACTGHRCFPQSRESSKHAVHANFSLKRANEQVQDMFVQAKNSLLVS